VCVFLLVFQGVTGPKGDKVSVWISELGRRFRVSPEAVRLCVCVRVALRERGIGGVMFRATFCMHNDVSTLETQTDA